jgi:hypothetical protein
MLLAAVAVPATALATRPRFSSSVSCTHLSPEDTVINGGPPPAICMLVDVGFVGQNNLGLADGRPSTFDTLTAPCMRLPHGQAMHGFVTNETLLENALATGQVMKVANMHRYLRLYKTGADVAILYKSEGRSPASVMVLPLVAPDAARIGGLYAISR